MVKLKMSEPTNLKSKIKKVCTLSTIHKNLFFPKYDKDELQNDWLKALDFFFDHVFYGGRREKLSQEYKERAFEIIRNKVELNKNTLNHQMIEEIFDKLALKVKGQNKFPEYDNKMVKNTLELLLNIHSEQGSYNIINYSLKKIDLNKPDLMNIFDELNKIHNIAQKKGTLYLRDLISFFELEEQIRKNSKTDDILIRNFSYLCPIDTWVFQVSSKLGILKDNEFQSGQEKNYAETITRFCFNLEDISVMEYNQGAFALGFYFGSILSVEKAINNLDSVLQIKNIIEKMK